MKLTKLKIANRANFRIALLLSTTLVLQFFALAAQAKTDVVLHTDEGMKEHDSEEPRRLMHDVIFSEFNRGGLFNIVNTENQSQPKKYHAVKYHIGANLICFHAAKDYPVNVSISMQLARSTDAVVILTTNESINVDPKFYYRALKLGPNEFNRSELGQALTKLSTNTVKTFERESSKIKM